jgi:ATP-dependent Clp protease protease subunit
LSDDEIKELMDAETWMSAEDAVEKGFATEIQADEQSDKVAASARAAIVKMMTQREKAAEPKEPDKLDSDIEDLKVTVADLQQKVNDLTESISQKAQEPNDLPESPLTGEEKVNPVLAFFDKFTNPENLG